MRALLFSISLGFVTALAVSACTESNDTDGTDAAGESGSASTGESGAGTTDTGGTSEEDGAGGTTETETTETGTETTEAETETSEGDPSDDDASGGMAETSGPGEDGSLETGSTTGADVCEPPGDDCGDCMAANCCEASQACLTDTDCSCFQACAAANPDAAISCADPDQCDIPITELLDPSTVIGALTTCTQMNCVQCL